MCHTTAKHHFHNSAAKPAAHHVLYHAAADHVLYHAAAHHVLLFHHSAANETGGIVAYGYSSASMVLCCSSRGPRDGPAAVRRDHCRAADLEIPE